VTTIVFVHGAAGSGRHFHAQRHAFPNAIALNLPGHGGTPGSAATIGEFADFVEAELRARDLSNVLLCGHSMGGAIALELALRGTAGVNALALVGSGARLRVNPAFLQALRDDVRAGARALAPFLYAELDREREEQTVADFERTGGAQSVRDFEACNAFDVTERLPELSLPVLALTGERDAMTPPKYAQFLAGRVPDGRLRIVPEAGHMLMLEAPAETNAALAAFVQEVEHR